MSDDIRSILARLALVEGKTTPVTVKQGMNQQQKAVPQLPALFKPRNISPTLTKQPYQKHPMDGYMVGENALAEAMQEVEEDMLSKVKKDLTTYLDQLEQKLKTDPDLKNKAVKDIEDKNPAKAGAQEEDEIEEDDVDMDSEAGHEMQLQTQQTLDAPQAPIAPIEESPVKTYALEDGAAFECYGNERDGFELRRGGRSMPTRFKNLDHTDMAVKLFQQRKRDQDQNQDYIEER